MQSEHVSCLKWWQNLVEKVNAQKIDLAPMKKRRGRIIWTYCSSGESSHFYEERRRESVSSYGLTRQYHSAQIYAKIRRNVERNGGKAMDFYTMVLRKSGNDWVALCLENGLVGQGITKEESIRKLKEAIECFEDVRKTEEGVYNAPISIKELHEFLTIEGIS